MNGNKLTSREVDQPPTDRYGYVWLVLVLNSAYTVPHLAQVKSSQVKTSLPLV